MSEDSKVEWTNHTFNPWWGCTHVHEGCRFCYAEAWAKRFGVKWGAAGVRRYSSEQVWKQPLLWNKRAEKRNVRYRVFCCSMADVFEDWMGTMVDVRGNQHWTSDADCERVAQSDPRTSGRREFFHRTTMTDARSRLFRLIDRTPFLDWQLLTKRPENIRRMWPEKTPAGNLGPIASAPYGDPVRLHRSNVWLGTSISDQSSADKQVPELLKCRSLSPVLFLSCEPLLGPITLDTCGRGGPPRWFTPEIDHPEDGRIAWVICGGESGPHARPMHPQWAKDIRDQCQATGVSFFYKQSGEFAPLE